MNKPTKTKAFTLIELLVVIAVLGLLSSIVLVSLRGQGQRAEYANLLLYDAQIKHALGAYILGEWKFEGNINDTSGHNSITIMAQGTESYRDNEISELGKAFYFGGLSRILVDPFRGMDGLEQMAVSFWINTDDKADQMFFLSGSSGNFVYLYKTGDTITSNVLGLTPLEVVCSLPASFFQTGEWHHVVYTYDGDEQAIYVDGEMPDAASCSASTTGTVVAATQQLNIGNYGRGLNVSGLIDNFRVYAEGLSISEVQKIYAQEKVELVNK